MNTGEAETRLYCQNLDAGPTAQVKLCVNDTETAYDLYSEDGFALVAGLWLKLSAHYRRMYEPRWLGVPIIQLPEDIVIAQELIWRLRPDVIVETGVAHGGSLILSASICELIGNGAVVGVDVDIRPHNRLAIESHPLSKRIKLIQGSSIDLNVFHEVRALCQNSRKTLIILDSNHSAAHVAAELELYHQLVTPDSYLIAMDGAQRDVWDIPRGKTTWRTDHPLIAIENFVNRHPEFVVDTYCTRLSITASPGGYLRRVCTEEAAAA